MRCAAALVVLPCLFLACGGGGAPAAGPPDAPGAAGPDAPAHDGDGGGLEPADGNAPAAAERPGGGDLAPAPLSPRTEVDLDDGWRFLRADAPGAGARAFDDGGWT